MVTNFSPWQRLDGSTNGLHPTDLESGRLHIQGSSGNRRLALDVLVMCFCMWFASIKTSWWLPHQTLVALLGYIWVCVLRLWIFFRWFLAVSLFGVLVMFKTVLLNQFDNKTVWFSVFISRFHIFGYAVEKPVNVESSGVTLAKADLQISQTEAFFLSQTQRGWLG